MSLKEARKQYGEAYMAEHPEYFVRSDVPSRAKKAPDPKGKRWTDGTLVSEVRRWGFYPKSGLVRWTTWHVSKDGTAVPDKRASFVRPSFQQSERSLEAYAKRLGMVEVPR